MKMPPAPRSSSSARQEAPGSARLRVAIVAPSLGILGGQAVQAQRLLNGWRDDPDVEAFLLPIDPVPPGPLRHARKVKYLRTAMTQATYWPSLVRRIRRADVVHVFSASYLSFFLAPLPAICVARMLGKPVVLNYRSGQAADHLKRSPACRAALGACDRIVVPSRFLAEVFAEHGLSCRVISNTVDLDRFAFRQRAPHGARILSVRNFEPLYNVACTLRAFRLVQDQCPAASLTLAGGGSQLAMLTRLAGELGLRSVRFLGRIHPSEIWRLYEEADLYVQTPDIDNMPSSILEAFASGVPVVATRVGGVPFILEHGTRGLLSPPNDHEAVASHLLTLQRDADLAARLAAAARASCERYRWCAVRGEWLSLYRELATQPARAEALPA